MIVLDPGDFPYKCQPHYLSVMLKNLSRRGLDLLAKLLAGRESLKPVSSSPLPVPMSAEDIERFREPMFTYWSSLGHPPATCEMFLRDAFNTDGYVDAVSRALNVMGDLRGKKILDVGCGWGGLSRVLSQCGADMTMVDPFPPHIETARARVPQAIGLLGSGTDLAAAGLTDELFDHVFVYSVIEHVGLPPDHRGNAEPVLEIQLNVISEAARRLKPGGYLMVSTGNYLFPFDGEVQIWFFHYFPKTVQLELLEALGRSADKYGLLTWAQLLEMAESSGLQLAHVETCETDGLLKTMENCMSPLFGAGVDAAQRHAAMGRIKALVTTDPNWMPMWHAFFRKPDESFDAR